MSTPPSTLRSESESSGYHWVANAKWLVLLRWVAAAGQLVTIGFARFLLPLPVWPLVGVIICTAVSNLALTGWVRRLRRGDRVPVSRRGSRVLAAVMAADILALTALLYFSGGIVNPFAVFYLVNLALAAVLLSERWGWGLTAVAAAGMIGLLTAGVDRPDWFRAPVWTTTAWLVPITWGQVGLIAAIVLCALVIIHFVSRVTRQLELTAAELRRVERERSRSEKLEALGTLAGGAAHELATPLSTIAVVANEMSRGLQSVEVPTAIRDDVALIRSEVDHCRTILQRMTGRAGRWMAEEHVMITVQELIDVTLDELAHASRVELIVPAGADQVTLQAPPESLAQALRGLLQNACDATSAAQSIRLTVGWNAQEIKLVVQDEGSGMTAEVKQRAGEPFFTTKEPGRGMGLGLFLTRSVIERLGGRLDLQSLPDQGVTADVTLPRR